MAEVFSSGGLNLGSTDQNLGALLLAYDSTANAMAQVMSSSGDLSYQATSSQGPLMRLSPDSTSVIFSNVTFSSIDINGGTIDGTVIGGSVPAALSATTGTFSDVVQIGDNTDSGEILSFAADRSGANTSIGLIRAVWDGTTVASINLIAGTDTGNKDDGSIEFKTASAGTALDTMTLGSDRSTTLFGELTIPAAAKFNFDGVSGNTYMTEVSPNLLRTFVDATEIMTLSSTVVEVAKVVNALAGVQIGTGQDANHIDDSTHGSGSTTLFIGNETIDTTVSDIRTKSNFADAGDEARAHLGLLAGALEEYDHKGARYTGHVSQRLNGVLPQYVRVGAKPDDMWSVRYNYMVGPLLWGWEDHEARIDSNAGRVETNAGDITQLKKENAELRDRVEDLEALAA